MGLRGPPPLFGRPMTGAQRQRRYMARLRQEAGRAPGRRQAVPARLDRSLPATGESPPRRRLTRRTKEREAHAETADGGEYQVNQIPKTGNFEVAFYDDTGRLDLLPGDYATIDAAKAAAERHSAES